MMQGVNFCFPQCPRLSQFLCASDFCWNRTKTDPALVFGSKHTDTDRFERRHGRTSVSSPNLLDTLVKHIEPAMVLDDIEDLPINLRKKLPKIIGIIFDLDNTLLPLGSDEIPQEVINVLHILNGRNKEKYKYKMAVVTNNKWPERCQAAKAQLLKEGLRLPFIDNAYKPNPASFDAMRKHFKLKPEEIAVVGDGLFCDMFCANQLGMHAIHATWFVKEGHKRAANHALDAAVAVWHKAAAWVFPQPEPQIQT